MDNGVAQDHTGIRHVGHPPACMCMWRVACGVWRVACGMCVWHVRVACGMWRVACGMWRVACGMWHVHVYGMCVWRVACGLCMCVLHVRVCVSPPSPAVHHATAEEEAVEGEQRAVRLPLAEGEAPAVKAHSSAAGPYDGFGRVAKGWTLPRRLKDM